MSNVISVNPPGITKVIRVSEAGEEKQVIQVNTIGHPAIQVNVLAASALPSQGGHTDEWLHTDGVTADWAELPIVLVTPAALSTLSDSNITLSLGGSPSNALLQDVTITVGWNGTLPDLRISSAAYWNSKQAPLGYTPENIASKNQPNGYAGLNSSALITDPFISSAAAWNAKQAALGYTPENIAHKNAVNGYAGLNGSALIVDSLISSASAWNAKQAAIGYTPENAANKNIANGYAGLNASALIVDALISSATAWNAKQNALGFTPVPNSRTINSYALSADITITKSDLGLGSVDNTTDIAKPVSTAQQTAINLKLDKSAGAHSFRANKTNATANVTELSFQADNEQTGLANPTVTGGSSAPSSTQTHSYNWIVINNWCWYHFSFLWATTGSANTTITFPLPADMPNPKIPNGFSAASAILYRYIGYAMNSASAGNTITGLLRQNSGQTGFEFNGTWTSINTIRIIIEGAYPLT